jgi:hypothetical protein
MVLEAAGHDPLDGADLDFYPRPPSFLDMLSRSLSPFLEWRSMRLQLVPELRAPQALELPAEVVDLLIPTADSRPMSMSLSR